MDAELLEALYQKYYPGALLYCTALCGDEQLAQDLTADAFVKAYLSLPEEISSFRYWLLRVCRNLWIDHLRRRKHEAPEDALLQLSDGITPETLYLRCEQSRALWQAIAALPSSDREILILHYFSGMPLPEIAQLTGKSYTALRQRMVRLRKVLKSRLEEQGYGYAF